MCILLQARNITYRVRFYTCISKITKLISFQFSYTYIDRQLVYIRYSSDVTLQLRASNLLALSSNLLKLVQSYLWQVFYYPRGTHARLLDDLWELFLTWLRMLTVIDHHNVLRLVLRLVSRNQNLCHRALIRQALIISNE